MRRNRRLVAIVEDLVSSPESSVPLASRDRAALQGMYDFWANPRIRAGDILAAHEADWVLESEEWQALCEHYHAPPRSPDDPPGLGQCNRWIAQLGGFWGRNSDGDPGARTIWRGLRRLRDLVRQRVLPRAIAASGV